MILIIIATLILSGLLLFYFVNPIPKHKLIILSSLVVSLVLTNLFNEFYTQLTDIKTNEIYDTPISMSSEIYKFQSNTKMLSLTRDQKSILQHLTKRHKNNENLLTYFQNLNYNRFKLIFSEFQKEQGFKAAQFNFNTHSIKSLDKKLSKSELSYLIIQNGMFREHFHTIKNVYTKFNVSIILKHLPYNYTVSCLGNWIEVYHFQNNYLQQIMEKQPHQLLQLCHKYRTFDYPFYLLSQTQPLSELCTNLPTNKATQCIRDYMNDAQDEIPYLKVNHCIKIRNGLIEEGIILKNGLVKLKRQFYYSGKVDKALFIDETKAQL